ncbi:MAG: ornithine carbamoyltransferase [Phycisphaerales bacterium]|jgi:ornithine carbamoyltransferase|nr:ornithine carbamoyltransferase [Phycisphaerales bacterium]
MHHFTSIAENAPDDLRHLLDVAGRLKAQYKTTGRNDPILAGKVLAMIFEKPSLRTRVSFNNAAVHLGGTGLLLRDEEVGLDSREPTKDVARVLSGMCDGIMARTFAHEKILTLRQWSTVPVINGLTDYSHPCQAMADLMTIREHFGSLEGKTVAFIGDGNNVARSLSVACGKFNMRFILASPPGYELPKEDVDRIMSQVPQMDFQLTADPADAARQADVLYTDTWVSMGQEAEKARRLKDFAGFQIDQKMLSAAPQQAVVLHCLPAYRGLEISDEVMEDPRSLIFPQAENRLHFQKGLLAVLMGGQ